ncbi:MAG: hypothetical protein LBU74_00565 [Methanobacteriaceae archaeon]|jgi:uncharacterized protein YwgA|nr:hypothetical protein [Candidatus Methanorudis spinitermitis]
MKNKEKLNVFINLLKDKIGFSFNIEDFDDRLKLQKYVFISKYFGFNHSYVYNLYIRGPYSSDLANDYYDISPNEFTSNISLKIDMDSFSSLIKDKDIKWLESAATMLSLYSSYKNNYNNYNKIDSNRLIKETNTIKHRIDFDIIKTVYSDLNDYNLFN